MIVLYSVGYFYRNKQNSNAALMLLYFMFIEIRCGAPSSVENTTHQVNRDGVHAEYKCLPNYELEDGELIKICTDNGTWFGDDPICGGE